MDKIDGGEAMLMGLKRIRGLVDEVEKYVLEHRDKSVIIRGGDERFIDEDRFRDEMVLMALGLVFEKYLHDLASRESGEDIGKEARFVINALVNGTLQYYTSFIRYHARRVRNKYLYEYLFHDLGTDSFYEALRKRVDMHISVLNNALKEIKNIDRDMRYQ